MVGDDAQLGDRFTAFAVPAVVFASLFGYRFVDDGAAVDGRDDLVAVATVAGALSMIAAVRVAIKAHSLGRSVAITLTTADLIIAVGAVTGAADLYRHRAPYLVGWFIDVAALGWIGAAAVTFRSARRRRH